MVTSDTSLHWAGQSSAPTQSKPCNSVQMKHLPKPFALPCSMVFIINEMKKAPPNSQKRIVFWRIKNPQDRGCARNSTGWVGVMGGQGWNRQQPMPVPWATQLGAWGGNQCKPQHSGFLPKCVVSEEVHCLPGEGLPSPGPVLGLGRVLVQPWAGWSPQ